MNQEQHAEDRSAWNTLDRLAASWAEGAMDRDRRLALLITTRAQAREVCRSAIEELHTFGVINPQNAAKWFRVWDTVCAWDGTQATVDLLEDALRSMVDEHDRLTIELNRTLDEDRLKLGYSLAAVRHAEALLCAIHQAAIDAHRRVTN
mgnify:CR=1 FL=1